MTSILSQPSLWVGLILGMGLASLFFAGRMKRAAAQFEIERKLLVDELAEARAPKSGLSIPAPKPGQKRKPRYLPIDGSA